MRSDAARNRQRILDAASELFAERGLGVTLNDIARHAGVGVGTAYRRFANKEEVIEALFEERITALVTMAERAAAHPDAWQGLVDFLDEALEVQFGDRGLNDLMNAPSLGTERTTAARDKVAPLLRALLSRAQEAGQVRPDLDQTDLVFLQVALSAVMNASRAVRPDLYRRYLTLFLDSLRAEGPRAALPVGALTAEETHRAMTSGPVRR